MAPARFPHVMFEACLNPADIPAAAIPHLDIPLPVG